MTSQVEDRDFTSLLSELTLDEKITLLSGRDFSTAAGVPRLNIPPIKVADSIAGVRPSGLTADMTTACFPNTACLGSTWDATLLGRLGEQLACQARDKSAQVVLGPTINMHRDPRAGRNFECFSEDPLLSGQLAGAIVNGVQSRGVGSCPKHFVCNDSETLRHFYDVQASVDGRTLREVYMAAWQHLLRTANPTGIMTAYNKVDGTFCSEHGPLIEGVLRKEWGFEGIVMSDWFAVHNVAEPIKAGLDLEMPFPVFRGKRLAAAVRSGEVTEAEIDARALKMLDLRNRTRSCHGERPERSEISEETNKLARELAAGGIVLLKNERGALPISPSDAPKIALIGEFAGTPVVTGGGSASCKPQYMHSPFEVLKETFSGDDNVQYHAGVRTRRVIPLAPTAQLTSDDGRHGIDVRYYNGDAPEPILTEFQEKAEVWMLGEFKPGLKVPGSRVELSTNLTPETTGEHTLAVRATGEFSLTVDGHEVLSGPQKEIATEQFIFNHVKLETRVQIPMNAGQAYTIRLSNRSWDHLVQGEPTPYAAALCFEEYRSDEAAIQEAAELARKSDVSIVYAGRNEQYESEGYDLDDIRMPANQTALIKAVAAASRGRTVLVLHCGNPVDVSAVVDDVDAVLLAHFPGQEGARATAEILAGETSPSGRLATTWFRTLEDAPSFGDFPATKIEDGGLCLRYAEGLGVGYRHAEATRRARWEFGYGLSYTSFGYSDLAVAVVDEPSPPSSSSSVSTSTGGGSKLRVSVTVTNTGSRAGREVVQLYVTPAKGTAVWRPARELKAFEKMLLQPGESREVVLEVEVKVACSYWDEAAKAWRLEEGRYGVQVGNRQGNFSVLRGSVWNGL
ncbi:Putative glycoside hydrolase, family 3, glycoside hydrolase family 3 domain, immunoglobulin [Colletotrichum destructivum]|uniref:beta-glucosidase n=1 Tax=Colletotrichum destructivum TaxID=34406 RepID=A0AAX4J3B0_9PEZI|nr:Putative glycoside hydrolase, family 3, glycoside hydrolase family 3 domain, immunoglobulin [Colletotrichum destructivum]